MRRDDLYLIDILEACDSADRFVRGLSQDDFCNDDLVRSATLVKLIFIGEAAKKLSPELKEDIPAVPWPLVAGFRNMAVHAYFAIAWDKVWEIATRDVPPLRSAVAGYMERGDFDSYREYCSRRRGE